MREASGLHGCFTNWSRVDRDEKLKRLARAINTGQFRAIYSVTDLEGFALTYAVHNTKPLNDPYFWPFHTTIMAVCFDLLDFDQTEPFEIIFDEQVIFGPPAKLWYPIVKSCMDAEEQAIMPVEPVFRNDLDFLPLQAADLLAWLFRRAWSGYSGANSFGWMAHELSSNTPMSPHSQIFTKERMARVIAQSYKIKVFPEAVINKYREILGQDPL
jgi:hypothetical protein